MKKLTFLIAFAIICFYGCNKQDSIPAADSQQVDNSGNYAFVFDNNSESHSWEKIPLSEIQSNSGSSTLKNGNSAHTHGDFAWSAWSISFSGTQNNGGTHGSAEADFVNGPFSVHLIMDTECVMVEGNEAVYGGTFTEVINNPFPSPGPFDVGNTMYFKVIDNGQGNKAPADQHVATILIFPVGISFCGILSPSNPLWSASPTLDVVEPGSIKVN